MKTMSRAAIWVRGILITAAATLAFLVNDPAFRSLVPPLGLSIVGALSVALLTLRAFIDQSPAQGVDTPQKPVPVVNAPGETLAVDPSPDATATDNDLKETDESHSQD